MAPSRIRILVVIIKLLVVWGSSLALLANRDRYVLMILSMAIAAAATTKIRTMRRKSRSPHKLSGAGIGVGVTLMAEAPFICFLP
jgi:hypothetical protein